MTDEGPRGSAAARDLASEVPERAGHLSLPVTKAEGEDVWCSCLVCGFPRSDFSPALVGLPVEFLVRIRTGSETAWRGLHLTCWHLNGFHEPLEPRR